MMAAAEKARQPVAADENAPVATPSPATIPELKSSSDAPTDKDKAADVPEAEPAMAHHATDGLTTSGGGVPTDLGTIGTGSTERSATTLEEVPVQSGPAAAAPAPPPRAQSRAVGRTSAETPARLAGGASTAPAPATSVSQPSAGPARTDAPVEPPRSVAPAGPGTGKSRNAEGGDDGDFAPAPEPERLRDEAQQTTDALAKESQSARASVEESTGGFWSEDEDDEASEDLITDDSPVPLTIAGPGATMVPRSADLVDEPEPSPLPIDGPALGTAEELPDLLPPRASTTIERVAPALVVLMIIAMLLTVILSLTS